MTFAEAMAARHAGHAVEWKGILGDPADRIEWVPFTMFTAGLASLEAILSAEYRLAVVTS